MIRVMFISFWTNLFLTSGKVLVGFFGMNHALVADGVASFSDMVTDILAIIGGIFSKKRADKSHPFGYGRVEYIVSFLVGIVILVLGFYVILNLSVNITSIPKIYTLLFASSFILIKFILVSYLDKMGKKLDSQIIIDSTLESKVDIYGTLVVIISTTLMLFSDYIWFFKYADFVASLIISILIFKTGITIIVHNISELINKNFSGNLHKAVREIIMAHEEISSIKRMYLLKYGTYYQLLAKIIFKKDIQVSKAHDVVEKIEKELRQKNIKHAFIEIDSK